MGSVADRADARKINAMFRRGGQNIGGAVFRDRIALFPPLNGAHRHVELMGHGPNTAESVNNRSGVGEGSVFWVVHLGSRAIVAYVRTNTAGMAGRS